MTKPTTKRKTPQTLMQVSPAAKEAFTRIAHKVGYGTRIAAVDAIAREMAMRHGVPFAPKPKSSGRPQP